MDPSAGSGDASVPSPPVGTEPPTSSTTKAAATTKATKVAKAGRATKATKRAVKATSESAAATKATTTKATKAAGKATSSKATKPTKATKATKATGKATKAAKAAKPTRPATTSRATKPASSSTTAKATNATVVSPDAVTDSRTVNGARPSGAEVPTGPSEPAQSPGGSPQPPTANGRKVQGTNDDRWPLATRALAGLFRHPELVLGALGRRPPIERDGRVLNRSVQALMELSNRFTPAAGPDGGPADPTTTRDQFTRLARLAMPIRRGVHSWGRIVPGSGGAPPVPVRAYRRYGTGMGDGQPSPAIVYFHGGGWVTGGLDSHDASCRLLAATSRCLVVSVGYRLAPEDPFPAAVDDALAAYTWVQHHAAELGIDRHRVGVMGDSAGGNLAAVVALEMRSGRDGLDDDVAPPVAQGLIYPAVDARLDTESLQHLGEGFFLTRQSMELFRRLYLPDPSDWADRRASPLLAGSHDNVAPALVITAGFDPLLDDGANYADVLSAAGVEVEYRCYDDQVHGFMGMGILKDSLALATQVNEAMGQLVRRSPVAGRA